MRGRLPAEDGLDLAHVLAAEDRANASMPSAPDLTSSPGIATIGAPTSRREAKPYGGAGRETAPAPRRRALAGNSARPPVVSPGRREA